MLESIFCIDFPLGYKSMKLFSIEEWRKKIKADPSF
jgi:hypothetical protein